MPGLTVNNGAGTPSISPIALTVAPTAGTPNTQVLALWANTIWEDPPGVWNHAWVKLSDYTPPSVSVPGRSVGRTESVDPLEAIASWTAITDVNDARYGWNVQVTFFNFDRSVQYAQLSYAQTAGTSAPVEITLGGSIEVDFRYVNAAGNGPTDTETYSF